MSNTIQYIVHFKDGSTVNVDAKSPTDAAAVSQSAAIMHKELSEIDYVEDKMSGQRFFEGDSPINIRKIYRSRR